MVVNRGDQTHRHTPFLLLQILAINQKWRRVKFMLSLKRSWVNCSLKLREIRYLLQETSFNLHWLVSFNNWCFRDRKWRLVEYCKVDLWDENYKQVLSTAISKYRKNREIIFDSVIIVLHRFYMHCLLQEVTYWLFISSFKKVHSSASKQVWHIIM